MKINLGCNAMVNFRPQLLDNRINVSFFPLGHMSSTLSLYTQMQSKAIKGINYAIHDYSLTRNSRKREQIRAVGGQFKFESVLGLSGDHL